jgi:hypothetical protein
MCRYQLVPSTLVTFALSKDANYHGNMKVYWGWMLHLFLSVDTTWKVEHGTQNLFAY